jgi:hypothetical protein
MGKDKTNTHTHLTALFGKALDSSVVSLSQNDSPFPLFSKEGEGEIT